MTEPVVKWISGDGRAMPTMLLEHLDPESRGLVVERAVGQTIEMGAVYAAVPEPWIVDWLTAIQARFRRDQTAGASKARAIHGLCGFQESVLRPELVDGEGNVILCLLGAGHEGECGGPGQRQGPPARE